MKPLTLTMKISSLFNGNAKRLFVPVNEFQFNGFAVRVRPLTSRQSKTPRLALSLSRRHSRSRWPVAAVRAQPFPSRSKEVASDAPQVR
jgi:hypothetical protein